MTTGKEVYYLSELISGLLELLEKYGDHPAVFDSGLWFDLSRLETAFSHSPELLADLDQETRDSLLGQPPKYYL